jgi:mono/diheme cytochrome c family protein
VLTLAAVPAGPAAAATTLDGKQLFQQSRCDLCHGVSTAGIQPRASSEKMRGPDLVNLSDRRSTDWLIAYMRGNERIGGEKHEPGFTGSDEELGALLSWLLDQKR